MVKLTLTELAITDIKEFPGNARKGNIDEIVKSLKANGQYKPVVVQKSTSFILAGNNTVKAAKKLGWGKVSAVLVDVDDNEARRINLADNRTSDLATYDIEALSELLVNIQGFDGTGYTVDDLDDLIAAVEEVTEATGNYISDPAPRQQTPHSAGATNTDFKHDMAYYADRYASKATRVLLCDYANEDYIWVIERLLDIRKEHGLETNAQAVIKMAELVTGETKPELTIVPQAE
jgi:hypothetical protein